MLKRLSWLVLSLLFGVPWVSAVRQNRVAVAGASPGLEDLRKSVFRISVYRRLFHWSRPYDDHDVTGSLGSGFLISLDPPTICTCAHVVAGAEEVFVQVTEFGRTRFSVRVATIDYDTDAAILLLHDPAELLDKLKDAKITLEPLKLASQTPPLGRAVVAPGFPLGQESLTLSTGVISGVDHVDFHHRNLALQSTAIISPGNSGSPLLDAESREVIGMNYAKLTGEAQINYAVALWRLKQVVRKHKDVHAKEQNHTVPFQRKLVDHGLVITAGLNALYMKSRSGRLCKTGPLISSVHPDSPFRDAVPPVTSDSFLVSVDGANLDRYGQGSKNAFVEELVDFDDLLTMRSGTGDEGILVETCNAATGEVQKHNVSLAWRADRQGVGIRYIHDPRIDQVKWEIFEDLLFMDLTQNHIKLSGIASYYHLLEPEARQSPRLAVFLIKEGGQAQEALDLREGSDLAIVDSINGHPVKNLDDLKLHFLPEALTSQGVNGTSELADSAAIVKRNMSTPAKLFARRHSQDQVQGASTLEQEHQLVLDGKEVLWSMRTTSGKEYAALFTQALKSQADIAQQGSGYMLTTGTKAVMEQLGVLPSSSASLLDTHAQENIRPRPPPATMPEKFSGEPLESIRRDPKAVVVDFPRGEGFNVW